MSRRSTAGWADFARNFTTMYNLGNQFARDIEINRAMKEEPEQYTDEQETDASQAARDAGLSGPLPTTVVPKWKYGGKTYDAPLTEEQLRTARYRRLGDIYTKYGMADKALEMDKNLAALEAAQRENRIGAANEANSILLKGDLAVQEKQAGIAHTQAGTEGLAASTRATNTATDQSIEKQPYLMEALKLSNTGKDLSNQTLEEALNFDKEANPKRQTLLDSEVFQAGLTDDMRARLQPAEVAAKKRELKARQLAADQSIKRGQALALWQKANMNGEFHNNDERAEGFFRIMEGLMPPEEHQKLRNKYDNEAVLSIIREGVAHGARINTAVDKGDIGELEKLVDEFNGPDTDAKIKRLPGGGYALVEKGPDGKETTMAEGPNKGEFLLSLKAQLSPDFYLQLAEHQAGLKLKEAQTNKANKEAKTPGRAAVDANLQKTIASARETLSSIYKAGVDPVSGKPLREDLYQAAIAKVASMYDISPEVLGGTVSYKKKATNPPAPRPTPSEPRPGPDGIVGPTQENQPMIDLPGIFNGAGGFSMDPVGVAAKKTFDSALAGLPKEQQLAKIQAWRNQGLVGRRPSDAVLQRLEDTILKGGS